MTDLRRDPLAGRWVAIAPARAARPGASEVVEDELESCPFCAGHEDRTPPETLRLGDGPTGWAVRVVPNLYPALERQEVVVHGPEHNRSLGELDDATLDLIAEAWQRRARDAGGFVFPIVNEGHEAGASLPHSHSQLAWLPGPPPAGAGRTRPARRRADPRARRADRRVPAREKRNALRGADRTSGLGAGRAAGDLLGPALRLLADLVRRLQQVRGEPTPFNVWLHDGPRWHLELVPRTTRLAGAKAEQGFHQPVPPERRRCCCALPA